MASAVGSSKNKWLQEKAQSIQVALAQGRPNVVWRDIRAIRECRAGIQPVRCYAIKKKNGEVCVGSEETLYRWREHFEGVLNVIGSSNQAALEGVEHLPLRSGLAGPPDKDDILRALGRLAVGRAGSLNGLLPDVLKCCGGPLLDYILMLFQTVWKEKIVAQQLSSYLESNQSLSPYHCAYRQGKSTEQLLLVAVDAIASALDKKLCACVAFLDLRKAFDSLDHCLLLQRLGTHGVAGTEISWFASYLSDRFQRVKYCNSYSNWGMVRGGIPQGSALGPLLFLVYMNDLSLQMTGGTLLQYADDTALICSGSTLDVVHQCLSDDLSCLLSWVKQSKMQLNIEKSSIMWFQNHSLSHISSPDVVVDGAPLRIVTTQKYLGVIFDNHLK